MQTQQSTFSHYFNPSPANKDVIQYPADRQQTKQNGLSHELRGAIYVLYGLRSERELWADYILYEEEASPNEVQAKVSGFMDSERTSTLGLSIYRQDNIIVKWAWWRKRGQYYSWRNSSNLITLIASGDSLGIKMFRPTSIHQQDRYRATLDSLRVRLGTLGASDSKSGDRNPLKKGETYFLQSLI
ncbi:uncharacterized protein BDR25DRAFT_363545 [Lindgomyces ingoldianus]|uniref:Uncharacterized protein n=1 Tax=Lindgomyces ingoldianus TaxID=673940 RepID=A0ACB6Q897_9PLEO|nr:uncharacterized protein BDR25DRAFT_363545 [Lindgomyces ingoldianus]KAF2462803.1 hypothetical protein BDR25DRAFT_363545 [Lindgomyces ingoldianus]